MYHLLTTLQMARLVTVPRLDGGSDQVTVYGVDDFPYTELDTKAMKCNNKRKCAEYLQTFGVYDIETTTIYKGHAPDWIVSPWAFMYHWQMDVGGYLITGRTWEEWLTFFDRLEEVLQFNGNKQLVIYVHNLGYEFQFMRDFLNKYFDGFTVFASKARQPITVQTGRGVQFRCSYKLTNMSLEKAVENELGVVHAKAAGDLDYKKIRTPKTRLTETEDGYCVGDVISLYELIERRLINEHDNLETIPMTSTGYVRRMCRKACRKDGHYRQLFKETEMNPYIYTLLKEAGRGGNTHANRYMSGKVWHNADSFDVQSSYPFCLCALKFPINKFTPYGNVETLEEFDGLLKKNACLFRVVLQNPTVRESVTMPYIPVSKCTKRGANVKLDNGRVLSCDWLQMTVTDIDWEIIKKQYTWDSFAVTDMCTAKYDYLPECLVECIRNIYSNKCKLKNQIEEADEKGEDAGDAPYLYSKIKNLLNACFGMAYTDPVKQENTINEKGEWIVNTPDTAEALARFYRSRNSFLYYAWGVWCTAHARKHLQQLLDLTGDATIYCDTDSSKAVGADIDAIEKVNKEIADLARKRGAFASVGGKDYFMGVYEHENKEPIKEFKTLGAKKYAYVDHKGLHCTVSGVSKKRGAQELKTIDNFKIGFIFRDAGGMELYYNDNVGIHQETVNGCTFTTASNVAMIDGTYTLGVTDTYAELISPNDHNILKDYRRLKNEKTQKRKRK